MSGRRGEAPVSTRLHRALVVAAPVVLAAAAFSCASFFGCRGEAAMIEAPGAAPSGVPAPARAPEPPASSPLVEVDADLLPAFEDDLDPSSLVAALDGTLHVLARRGDAEVTLVGYSCPASSIRAALLALRESVEDGEPPARLVRELFRTFRAAGPGDGALVTGYYEPVLEARRRRGDGFVHPIYRRPDDLVEIRLADFPGAPAAATIHGRVENGRLAPYHSRREIDEGGALEGRGLEIAWLRDPVDRFFLHVQGSGILDLGDGRHQRVGYDASNGRPYTSIGRILRDAGELAPGESTAPAIQRWLRENPEERDRILFANERYIFFREVSDGPIGSLGVPLTAGRSIAVDPAVYPPGLLAWLETRSPVIDGGGKAAGRRPLRRFVLAQDAGAAITGPGRVDLFFGTGARAGLEAGHMGEPGELFFLFPRCG